MKRREKKICKIATLLPSGDLNWISKMKQWYYRLVWQSNIYKIFIDIFIWCLNKSLKVKNASIPVTFLKLNQQNKTRKKFINTNCRKKFANQYLKMFLPYLFHKNWQSLSKILGFWIDPFLFLFFFFRSENIRRIYIFIYLFNVKPTPFVIQNQVIISNMQ
jgi:hypothetical protein